ncbi:MAG: sulfatase-like hydrolase/transferase [Proteobacteria bacterium]|nr:sulfatase-like hydrolase/transferase [Pseudomonadota bacterium]
MPPAEDPRRSRASSASWTIVAHVIGAVLIGAIDAARLGGGIGIATVPLFAMVGLLAGLAIGGAELVVARLQLRWQLAALVLALPSFAITLPTCATLFDGAFARTLPLAGALHLLVPIVAWLGVAVAVAIGRRLLRDSDLIARAIAILVIAGLFGALVKGKAAFVGPQYPSAQAGISMVLIVIAGLGVRVGRRGATRRFELILAGALAAVVIATTLLAMATGLGAEVDRERLAARDSASRDLVRIARDLVDRDDDGSSPILGGGDCDDHDATRFPGGRDVPGDGIDQDCDGVDAIPPVVEPPPPPAPRELDWRTEPKVAAMFAAAKTRDVVMITVDALRFDLLAPDAAHRDDFPNLVKLLDESAWFVHAIAPAAGTDVSLSTLLSGRIDPFQPVATTLIEAMRASGRRTYTAIPGEVTRYVGDTLIGRGTDKQTIVHTDWDVQDVGDHVSAQVTTLEGIRALDDAKGQPAFYWLHYFDVHEHHQIKLTKAQLDAVHDPGPGPKARAYRALLAQIDLEVAHFFAERATRGLAEPIVVFASDHGESLGEDPRLGETHGRVAYAALVHVPLAIRVPGGLPGQRLDPASLVDVAPTLLALVGTPDAMAPLDGRDLTAAIMDAPLASRTRPRALVVHEEWQWAVVEWPYQLIVNPKENLVELYDLDRDPREREDLSAVHPDIVGRLRLRYSAVPAVTVDRTPAGRVWRESQAAVGATSAPPPPQER